MPSLNKKIENAYKFLFLPTKKEQLKELPLAVL